MDKRCYCSHIQKYEILTMGNIIKIKRYGKNVSVQEELVGKRQEHSLCWQGCKKFNLNNVMNCIY